MTEAIEQHIVQMQIWEMKGILYLFLECYGKDSGLEKGWNLFPLGKRECISTMLTKKLMVWNFIIM